MAPNPVLEDQAESMSTLACMALRGVVLEHCVTEIGIDTMGQIVDSAVERMQNEQSHGGPNRHLAGSPISFVFARLVSFWSTVFSTVG